MEGRKRLLLVLFVPSADRDGEPVAEQARWVDDALTMLGTLFGGATAYPRARGVWRDDEREARRARPVLPPPGARDKTGRSGPGYRRRICRHQEPARGVAEE